MSEKEQNPPSFYQIIRGLPCPFSKRFKRKNIEDAMDLVPADGDLIIASYPKTGTTWMQYIVLQIKSKGQHFPSFDDATYKFVPFLELTGIDAVNAQDKPRIYKHHIPYDKVQKNDKSKYIYTYRNPEDTVVSFYKFIRNMDLDFKLNLNEFFENFVSGNIGYGSYFRHILSFYKHREDENLLMVSYEKLHANKREEILRIAKFLGEDKSLLEDDQILTKVMEHTNFDFMKKNLTFTHPDIITGVSDKPSKDEPTIVDFFRKGIVGDGKAVLSETQRQRLKAAAVEALKDTVIIDEWYPK